MRSAIKYIKPNRLSLLVFAICFFILPTSAQSQEKISKIRWPAYMAPPWLDKADDGSYHGILAETMNCVLQPLKIDLDVYEVPIPRLFHELSTGGGDLSVVLLAPEMESEEINQFAVVLPQTLHQEYLVSAIRSNDSPKGLTLANSKVGGSNLPAIFREQLLIDSSKYTAFNTELAIVKALLKKRIDIAIGIELNLLFHAKQLAGYKSITVNHLSNDSMNFKVAISKNFIQKHPFILSRVSDRISELKDNGVLKRIFNKYKNAHLSTSNQEPDNCLAKPT